jgi:hypothetical protein
MQRRRLLQLGLGAAAVLALAGTGAALVQPGIVNRRLSASSRSIFSAVATAVLDGMLPATPAARERMLEAHLERVQSTVHGLPPHAQRELSLLLALLATAPGRIALTGLRSPWLQASVSDLQGALQAMRVSSLGMKQQAYHALYEITNASFFADRTVWPLLGYPGPTAL